MTKYSCVRCNSKNTCRILYGLYNFDEDLNDKLNAGKVHLGGCLVSNHDPDRHCNDCQLDFDTRTPNVYLDIDGVLLAGDLTPAKGVKEFLTEVLDRYPYTTYWLTTHCQGDASTPIQHIGHLFDEETVELMKRIKPTKWATAKTRAIDFSTPFFWFDDNLFYEEEQTLLKFDARDSLIMVNLKKDPDSLVKLASDFPLFLEDEA